MARFLVGEALSAEIRRVCAGEDVRIAAAYWGRGAVENLGLTPGRARVVCEVGAGATHPAELRKLRDLLGSNARYVPNLHAKVYLSRLGVIAASANPSQNGIGFTGGPNLIEAGILGTGQVLEEAAATFDCLFDRARPIDDDAIRQATTLWLQRRDESNSQEPDEIGIDIFSMTKLAPCLFDGIPLFVSNLVIPDRIDIIRKEAGRHADSIIAALQNQQYEAFYGLKGESMSTWPEYFLALIRYQDQRARLNFQRVRYRLETTLVTSFETRTFGGRVFSGKDGLTPRPSESAKFQSVTGSDSPLAAIGGNIWRQLPNAGAFFQALGD